MTPYRERREAGEYDAPGTTKTAEERKAASTTTENLSGLTGGQAEDTETKPKNGRRKTNKGT